MHVFRVEIKFIYKFNLNKNKQERIAADELSVLRLGGPEAAVRLKHHNQAAGQLNNALVQYIFDHIQPDRRRRQQQQHVHQ